MRLGRRLGRLLRDHHHPAQRDALLERLRQQVLASIALREERRLNVPRTAYPPELPITARKDDIVAAIRAHQVVVIAGETGSGKTTQIPKMCLEAGLGIEAKIGCTQPRRVAALSISRRIAEELNVAWGREVGCKWAKTHPIDGRAPTAPRGRAGRRHRSRALPDFLPNGGSSNSRAPGGPDARVGRPRGAARDNGPTEHPCPAG